MSIVKPAAKSRRTQDWPALIERLRLRGWTQSRIASAVGVKQSTVSDLARTDRGDPAYFIGRALKDLDESGRSAPSEKSAA
jgi:transcriptional regulator with XRE-family HTH domain